MKSTSIDTSAHKDVMIQADQLASEGQYREAIELIQRGYDVDAVPDLARELINLRVRRFRALPSQLVDWDS